MVVLTNVLAGIFLLFQDYGPALIEVSVKVLPLETVRHGNHVAYFQASGNGMGAEARSETKGTKHADRYRNGSFLGSQYRTDSDGGVSL